MVNSKSLSVDDMILRLSGAFTLTGSSAGALRRPLVVNSGVVMVTVVPVVVVGVVVVPVVTVVVVA